MRLSKVYGHEEVLSRVIAEDGYLTELLGELGVKTTDKPELEKKVRLGHDQHAGRLDIYQPTTIGDVIVEVQYGRADYHQADRLQNYAKNFHQTALVIWIAESFSNEMLHRFLGAKTPVYCVKASYQDEKLALKNRTPKAHVLAKQDKRINQSKKKAKELIEVVHTIRWYQMGDMQPFSMAMDAHSCWSRSPASSLNEFVDYQLSKYPMKTRQFLWTCHDFQNIKEQNPWDPVDLSKLQTALLAR